MGSEVPGTWPGGLVSLRNDSGTGQRHHWRSRLRPGRASWAVPIRATWRGSSRCPVGGGQHAGGVTGGKVAPGIRAWRPCCSGWPVLRVGGRHERGLASRNDGRFKEEAAAKS